MTILDFDEVNKYEEFKERLLEMPPSELMDSKQDVVKDVTDLLEFAYMLGFSRASEELGVVADDILELLPSDYDDRMKESVYKDIAGKDFVTRVSEYAELGDAQSIIRVVETDGNRVYNSGGLLGARGIAKFKTWITQNDERVRETHSYLESMTVPYDEDFYTFDGDHAPYPGLFERVENNANCRCTVLFS